MAKKIFSKKFQKKFWPKKIGNFFQNLICEKIPSLSQTSLKILFRTMNSLKNIRRTKEIFMYKKYIDTTIRSTKTGNRTENRTPDHRENFMCKWTSMTKEIFLHKNFFDRTIRSTKTGNRTENRTPDQPEIFMDEPVWEYKFACIGIFSIGPTMFKRYQSAPTTTK